MFDVFLPEFVNFDKRNENETKVQSTEKLVKNIQSRINKVCKNYGKYMYSDLNVDTHRTENREFCIGEEMLAIETHRIVTESKKYNYEGCRIPLKTNLNVKFFRNSLQDYTGKKVSEFIEYGFPIGYDYNHKCSCLHEDESDETETFKNHRGAREFPDSIDTFIEKEKKYNAVLGPFDFNPFNTKMKISPLNTVEKKDSEERRVILDLSYPTNQSVNCGIDKDYYLDEKVTLTYPKVDDLVNIIKVKGRGCSIFKRDLKRAYRQIPIDPSDIHLVGYWWRNKYYFDRVLSFGLRSAAQICQRLTNTITFMCSKENYQIINYLDDFAGGDSPEKAMEAFIFLGELLSKCGLEESEQKALQPTTRMIFLGVLLDTLKLTLEIPEFRLTEIKNLMKTWLQKQSANIHDIQSLIGKLSFVASCVRPGRIFITRILNWFKTLPKVTHTQFKIPAEVKKDILWWREFFVDYNGVSMMMLEDWSYPDHIFSSDACLTGCGGFFSGKFFHLKFPEIILENEFSINVLELLAVMICVKIWGHLLEGKKIVILCDNQTTVSVLNSGKARRQTMGSILRKICFFEAKYQFMVKASYIEGAQNRYADLLSRWHLNIINKEMFYKITKN